MLLVHFPIAIDHYLSNYFEDSIAQVSECYDRQRYQTERQETSVTVFLFNVLAQSNMLENEFFSLQDSEPLVSIQKGSHKI